MSDWADNYNSFANTQMMDSCYKEGCMSDWADNYNDYLQLLMMEQM